MLVTNQAVATEPYIERLTGVTDAASAAVAFAAVINASLQIVATAVGDTIEFLAEGTWTAVNLSQLETKAGMFDPVVTVPTPVGQPAVISLAGDFVDVVARCLLIVEGTHNIGIFSLGTRARNRQALGQKPERR